MKKEIFISLLVASSLCAQSDDVSALANLSLEELLAVQFTEVSRKEQSTMNVPSAIYILNAEQIKRSGATNIPEALRLVPGVHVGRVSGSQYAVSIRSANTLLSDQILVMIDGREVFNRLFNGTYWDSIDTMLEDIDRIEVIRGPGGSLWGSNAGNGIINIVTKKATQTTGTLIATQIGSARDHSRISGRIGFGDDKSATRIYAMSKDVDQSTSPITHKTTNDALDFQQAGFRHDTQTNSNGQLSVHGDVYQGDSQLARSTPETVELSGGNLFALYKPNNDIRLQAYYDYTSRKRTTTKSTYHNFDLDYQQTIALSNHSLLFGGGARYTMHDYSHTSSPTGTIAVDPANRNDTTTRAFLQDEIKWGAFSVIPGIKYEYNNYIASQWQPSLKVAFSPSEEQTLWLSASRSIATPSRIASDGYLHFSNFTVSIAQTPLTPTTQNVYEAGYRIRPHETFLADIATFYNNYATTANNSMDKVYGAELNLIYQPLDLVRAEASYTYTNSETNANVNPNNIYKHMLNGHINYNPLPKIQTDAYYYYYSHTQTTDAINRVDLRIGYEFSPDLLIELVGQNLFNGDHIEPNQDSAITRNTTIEQSYLLKASLSF